MTQQTDAAQADDDEEYVMPCAEALMAGTLALMTGHARCGCAQHRDMMARKAAVNLNTLSHHPHISDGLRSVAQKLYEQWIEVIQADLLNALAVPAGATPSVPTHDAAHIAQYRAELSRAEKSRALWHTTPEVIQ